MMTEIQKASGHNTFAWERLGNIAIGRRELGDQMPVLVYRLMQFTMLDVLSRSYGSLQANDHFRQAGYLAGKEFAAHLLDLQAPFGSFAASLQRVLRDLKIGILRLESYDEETGEIMLTVEEDLDCSGLPVTHEMICYYDEGFIGGILEAYSGKVYQVREIDCWANGDRICRFHGITV